MCSVRAHARSSRASAWHACGANRNDGAAAGRGSVANSWERVKELNKDAFACSPPPPPQTHRSITTNEGSQLKNQIQQLKLAIEKLLI